MVDLRRHLHDGLHELAHRCKQALRLLARS
jgi:hypothetical protein